MRISTVCVCACVCHEWHGFLNITTFSEKVSDEVVLKVRKQGFNNTINSGII